MDTRIRSQVYNLRTRHTIRLAVYLPHPQAVIKKFHASHYMKVLHDDDDDDDDDDKLYLTTLTLSAETGFHNGRVKNINKLLQVK